MVGDVVIIINVINLIMVIIKVVVLIQVILVGIMIKEVGQMDVIHHGQIEIY